MFQIIPYDDVADLIGDVTMGADGYRASDLGELAPTVGMSAVDQFARTVAMLETDYESDGNGATARVVELTPSDLAMLELCAMADHERAAVADWETIDRNRRYSVSVGCVGLETFAELNPPTPYPLPYRFSVIDRSRDHAFIRSDDHGFWDIAVMRGSEARETLAAWIGENVAPSCGVCGRDLESDEVAEFGDACRWCAEVMAAN